MLPAGEPKFSALLIVSGVSKQKYTPVHRLVAEAFIENPLGLPCVNHKDGIKTNNSISNLEWCTNEENMAHSSRHGLHRYGEKHGRAALSESDVVSILYKYKIGNSISDIAKTFKVARPTIYNIVHRITWKHISPQ